jgi:hypothetical protein
LRAWVLFAPWAVEDVYAESGAPGAIRRGRAWVSAFNWLCAR